MAALASSASQQRLSPDGEESLSPLEQEVLEEYARLAGNLENVSLPHFPIFPWLLLFGSVDKI